MFVLGFATAAEIEKLEELGWDVEAAEKFGVVAPYTAEEGAVEDQGFFVRGDGYLMTKPEPGPDKTQAIAVFVDASVFDVLEPELFSAEQISMLANAPEEAPAPNSLSVTEWTKRRDALRTKASAMVADAEHFKYCSHKYEDDRDARYPTGNGETACICGNKWD